jgi:hypothetical protein
MGFTAVDGMLMDATGTNPICAVTNVKVADGIGRGLAAFVFQPTIDFATTDRHGVDGYVLVAGGRTLRIQLQRWGLKDGFVPYAEGVVVG